VISKPPSRSNRTSPTGTAATACPTGRQRYD
jgi:hypothetical protein